MTNNIVHYTIKNQETEAVEGMICIERNTQTCHVLIATIENIVELVNIAYASKVPVVRFVVPKDLISDLKELGWKDSKTHALLVYKE